MTPAADQIDIAALLEHAYRLAGDKSIVLFEIIRQLQGWGHEAKLVVRQTCRIRSRAQRDFTEHLYLGWGDEVHSLEDPRRVLSLSQVMAGAIQAPRHMDECGQMPPGTEHEHWMVKDHCPSSGPSPVDAAKVVRLVDLMCSQAQAEILDANTQGGGTARGRARL